MRRRKRQSYRAPLNLQQPRSRFDPFSRLQVSDVEQLTKVAAIFGLFFYVVGLLSVNGYLLNFGVTDFELIRTRFIYTGFLIVSSGTICAVPLVIKSIRPEVKGTFQKEVKTLRDPRGIVRTVGG